MKNRMLILLVMCALSGPAVRCVSAQEKPGEPNALFYQGNNLYQERDYLEALLAYDKVLDLGLESANLYYNIGNGFFKLNKLGHAILFFERAKRMKPYDSDIRSNLDYARSLAGETAFSETTDPAFVKTLKRPIRDLPLSALALVAIGVYLAAALLAAVRIVNPVFAKKIRLVLWVVMALCAYTLAVYAVRYYDEAVRVHGIVLQKNVEARYEPIDKSAVHYKLREGSEVLVLTTRDEWRRVRRADGKVGWVKASAVEAI